MARKSMKSRVPADVWAALTEMRQGSEASVYELGHGAQGVVYGVKGNSDWVIKRWRGKYDVQNRLFTDSDYDMWERWQAKEVAKDLARGALSSTHLPKVIYATNKFVVMERLEELEEEGDDLQAVWNAHATPYKRLPKEHHPIRRAIKRLKKRGYRVNDVRETNVMRRSNGTLVLNDVVA